MKSNVIDDAAKNAYPGLIDSRSILEPCCDIGAPALIISTAIAALANGRFLSVDDAEVTFLLPEYAAFRPLTLCCVSFTYKNRAYIFMANIVSCSSDDRGTLVNLEIPEHVTVAELRTTFRVPLDEESNLETWMISGKEETKVLAHDISLNGISVELPDEQSIPAINQTVELKLQGGGPEYTVSAQARNISERKCGLFFPAAMRNGEVDPPDELRKIVRDLEIDYVRREREKNAI